MNIDAMLEQHRGRRTDGATHGRRAGSAASASVSVASLLQEESAGGVGAGLPVSPLSTSGLNQTQVARIQQLLQEHSVKRVVVPDVGSAAPSATGAKQRAPPGGSVGSSGSSSSFLFDTTGGARPQQQHQQQQPTQQLPGSATATTGADRHGQLPPGRAAGASGKGARSAAGPPPTGLGHGFQQQQPPLSPEMLAPRGLGLLDPDDLNFGNDALLASVNEQLDLVAERLGLSPGPTAVPAYENDNYNRPAAAAAFISVGGAAAGRSASKSGAKSARGGGGVASLVDLERHLNKTMGMAALNTDPRKATADDGGPFDISELWGAAGIGSPSVDTHTTTHTHVTDDVPDTPVSRAPPSCGGGGGGGVRGHSPPTHHPHPPPTHPRTDPKPKPQPTTAARSTSASRLRPPPRAAAAAGAAHHTGAAHHSAVAATARTDRVDRGPSPPPEHPRVNAKSRAMVAANYPRDTAARIEQLAVPRAVAQGARQARLRAEIEEKELAECTFTPRTGRPPSPAAARGAHTSERGVPVHERLHAVRPGWLDKRGQALRARQEAALAECTFRPVTNASLGRGAPQLAGADRTAARAASAPRTRPGSVRPSGVGRTAADAPLHERVGEVLRAKSERLANARLSLELSGDTFKPQINRRSVVLAMDRAARDQVEDLSAAERLYARACSAVADGADRANDVRAEMDQECTFVPAVNERSRTIVANSKVMQGSFLERQDLRLSGGSGGDYWRISGGSGPATGGSRFVSPRGSEYGGGDVVTKLAVQDVRRSAALKQALKEHYDSQLSFSPEINPRSRRLARRHSLDVDDLVRGVGSGQGNRHSKCHAAAAAVDRTDEECSFRPQLNARSIALAETRATQRGSGSGSSLLNGVQASLDAAAERARRLAEARAQQEYEELRECTFAPEVNRPPPRDLGTPRVAGLSGVQRHLELAALARKQQEDKAKVEAKVWWREPKGNDSLFTVPRPFNFNWPAKQRGGDQRQAADQQQQQRHVAYEAYAHGEGGAGGVRGGA
ncbi:hypothetical protein FOA52_009145 [Chlamydomonas sp. UWO 241]|nr:hypothetical protein FOA52_009145 [Chlamydomonas sp. UWO 241]